MPLNSSYSYPYSPIAGEGLGTSYSSLAQIGQIYPHKGNGQANIQVYVNVANGNLHVKDIETTFQETNGPISLGYVYNSQAASIATRWQLTHKCFVQLPNGSSPGILQEEDGHLTTYAQTSNANAYAAPGCGDGTPYMWFDYPSNNWIWYHPRTFIYECYNTQGLLIARTDQEGRSTQYSYDSNNELDTITGPTGNQYKILRQNNGSTIAVSICEVVAGNNNVVQSYVFDTSGSLQTSQTASGYQVNYGYSAPGAGSIIYLISQSDNTSINFSTDDNDRVCQVATGYDGCLINYASQITPSASVVDGRGITTTIYMDANSRATQIDQQTGYDSIGDEVDTTSYNYTSDGQLQTQTNPDLGQITYTYDPVYGLMTAKTEPNGQVTQYYYHTGQPCMPSSKVWMLGQQQLVEHYVYDTFFNGNNLFLRFIISPEGRVTELRADAQGNIASKRVYLNALFDASNILPFQPIALPELEDWLQQQDIQQVSLTEYTYDSHGLPTQTIEYANIDSNGNGILDAFANVITTTYDEFGNLLTKTSTQTPTTTATTTQTFDSLQRLTSIIDPLQ